MPKIDMTLAGHIIQNLENPDGDIASLKRWA